MTDLIERRLSGLPLEYELPPMVAQVCEDALAELTRLRSQLAAADADARRYRWLRVNLGGDAPMIRAAQKVIDSNYVWEMDAAIDAAMTPEEKR